MNSILNFKRSVFLVALMGFVVSCVEEIPIESEGLEEAIVVEGTITDERKQHQIKLSRVFAIDDNGPSRLSGASVTVTGNSEYVFEETEPGIYTSRDSFAARAGVDYQLQILIDGEGYESDPMQLPGTSSIGEVEANRIDYRGENGVAITLNNQSSAGSPNYYRYEYVETFKFNANYFKIKDIIIEDGLPVEVPKTKEEYTCYRTEGSQEVILANTNSLSEDSVNNLLINFIGSDDPKISNRYSILVKQYVISRGAYTYYKTLEELSGSDNLFSQSQPGFFAGNITNINNPAEKVIGYFDVSSVTTKRTYFNYEDFYDPQNIRPRFVPYAACEPALYDTPTLIVMVESGTVKWAETLGEHSFLVVPARCVDCTRFGTNEKPDFWED